MKDDLGDRMKSYEFHETSRRFLKNLPIVARIDGRGFSKFTRGMERPYDLRMSNTMIDTTKIIVAETHATIGYTQSDEISIVWVPSPNGSTWFDQKITKMTSVLAALATSAFIKSMFVHFEDAATRMQKLPHFDARVIQMPNLTEAANMLLWRNLDCAKNSISMAASHYYSHNELQGKNSSDKHDMLYAKGVNWSNYPYFFKRGIFVRRRNVQRVLSETEWLAIPEKHRPLLCDTVTRSEVISYDLPPLNKVTNRVEVLFHGEDPNIITE